MDIRTISATLAILGTGLALSACSKKNTDATEVPAAKPAGADGSCGADKGHGHASCSADKAADGEKSCGAKGDGSCGGDKAAGEKSCGAKGDGSCGAAKEPPATAAAEPVAPASTSPTVAADATTPAATTKTKTKTKAKTKKANGEAACGEGTCA